MIEFRQKEYTIGSVAATGLTNMAHGASLATGGVLAGGAKMAAGLGQLGAAGLAKGAVLAVTHPLLAGGLAAYGIYRLLKRRRQRRMAERGYSVVERMYSDGSIYEYSERLFSDLSVQEQLDMPMAPPSGPRQEVPKKIVKKAQKSGVVQKDAEGNWRIINMHGPGGKPVYWKPKYKSKESAENVLRSYHSGGWNKK